MQATGYHLLSRLRGRATGYVEDVSDEQVVDLLKTAKAANYFLTSKLTGSCRRIQVFLSFEMPERKFTSFITKLYDSVHPEEFLPTEPEDVQESVCFYQKAFPEQPRPVDHSIVGFWLLARIFLDVKFVSSKGDSVFLTGPLLRWAAPSLTDRDRPNDTVFLWMATVPMDSPRTAALCRVFGGDFAPVGWRLPRNQGCRDSDAAWFPFSDHVPWKAHKETSDVRKLAAMCANRVAATLPSPTHVHQLGLPKCVVNHYFGLL